MLVTYYRRILFILGILGLGLQLFKYGLGRLLYYTILSNLAVVVFLGVTLYWMAQKKEATLLSHKFLRFKGGLTVNDFDSLYRLPFLLGSFGDSASLLEFREFLGSLYSSLGLSP